MIKVSVMYPETSTMNFDMDYYRNMHMPMIKQRLGEALKRYEIDRGISGPFPGSPPTYTAAVHMYFDSVDAFTTAFGPHAKEIFKDVVNYTNAKPLTQISEVVDT